MMTIGSNHEAANDVFLFFSVGRIHQRRIWRLMLRYSSLTSAYFALAVVSIDGRRPSRASRHRQPPPPPPPPPPVARKCMEDQTRLLASMWLDRGHLDPVRAQRLIKIDLVLREPQNHR